VLKGLDITDIPIKDAIATNRRLDQRFFDVITDLEVRSSSRGIDRLINAQIKSHPLLGWLFDFRLP